MTVANHCEEVVMRKLIVGLMMVGLLALAGPASAADNGTADPLGLISSAVIQPFWSAGANFTMFEITSPVGFNFFLHMVFFNAACVEDFSVPFDLTGNDILVFAPDDFGIDYNGLATVAWSFNNIDQVPIPRDSAIHMQAHWVNIAADYIRVVTPIAVASPETPGGQTWSPLRSAASWSNPLQGTAFSTTIYLVCPSSSVLAEIPASRGFPAPPRIAFGTTRDTSGITGIVYDDDEKVLRDVRVACRCIE